MNTQSGDDIDFGSLTIVSRFLTARVQHCLSNQEVERFKSCWSTQVKAHGTIEGYLLLLAFLLLKKCNF